MARILTPPIPKQWDVVRCFMEYPHDTHNSATHPALVLHVVESHKVGNACPIVVVAGGTGTHSPESGKRRKVHRGEIPLSLELCKSAGLSKETKFCFSEEGVIALYWDDEFFRWDPSNPNLQGEPLFGALDTRSGEFERFRVLFTNGPEYKNLSKVVAQALQACKR